MANGRTSEAVDSFRNAHAQDRENPAYEVALIRALTQEGRTAQADPLMREMLDREPDDGEVNLMAARLAIKEGKSAEEAIWQAVSSPGRIPTASADICPHSGK